jgi:hypothetical protein
MPCFPHPFIPRTTNTGAVAVETVGSVNTTMATDPVVQSGQQEPTSLSPYTTFFSDAFNYVDPSNTPAIPVLKTYVSTGVSKKMNESIEIDFLAKDTSNVTNVTDTTDGQHMIGSFRLIFEMFGESITDAELGWLLSMKFIDAADIIIFSALSAEQIYQSMTMSTEILHGYRRYGPTYIDRWFIDLYTTLQQIYLWFGTELKCQFSSRESIG